MEWNGNGMEMEIKWKIGIELNADLYLRQREMLQKYLGKIAVQIEFENA